eukprot:3941724-Rhodomonas_salina.4
MSGSEMGPRKPARSFKHVFCDPVCGGPRERSGWDGRNVARDRLHGRHAAQRSEIQLHGPWPE